MIEVYHGHTSVCSLKVRFVLAEKGIEWKGHLLDLEKEDQKQPYYLKLNPKGVVPTLVHDGIPIVESTVINEYLDQVFPEPPLKPVAPLAQARMRVWTKMVDEILHLAFAGINISTNPRFQIIGSKSPEEIEQYLIQIPDPDRREKHRQVIKLGLDAPTFVSSVKLFDKTLAEMEETLSDSLWLAGHSYSLADVSLASYIARIDMLAWSGMWETARPRVTDWVSRIKSRPSYKDAFDTFITPDVSKKITARGNDAWPKVKAILAS